jgi:DNA modification methylase
MKKLTIQYKPIKRLIPYTRNARTHSDDQITQVMASITEFGWTNPILLDGKNGIIAGHARLEAAKRMGLADVPCIELEGLSEAQKRAYIIADNKLALNAGWDATLLNLELLDLKELDFDLDLLGFDEAELAELMQPPAGEGLTDPDDVPEAPEKPVTVRGDLWILGKHRLLCGDSGSPTDLDRLLAGDRIQLVNTDPPYNVKVEPRSNNAIAAGNSSFTNTHHQSLDLARHPEKSKPTTKQMRAKDRPLVNDFISEQAFDDALNSWFLNIARVLEPGRCFYIWGGYLNVFNYPRAITDAGLRFAQIIVWVKEHPVLTRKDFMGNHESCFYGWRPGAAHVFLGPNNATDVWSVKKISPQNMVHLTEKPVELAARAIQYSSRPGENVLDLFGGSGSTMVGAEQNNRRSFLMEIDPPYCDVIVNRYQNFTGGGATLEGDGRTFEEIKKTRG